MKKEGAKAQSDEPFHAATGTSAIDFPFCVTGKADCHTQKMIFGFCATQAEADAYMAAWSPDVRNLIGAKIEKTFDNLHTPKS